jgi:hypothetical protein
MNGLWVTHADALNRKGMYFVTSMVQKLLEHAPSLMGSRSTSAKIVGMVAPVVSNLLGMAVNMSDGVAVEKVTLEQRVHVLENEVGKIEVKIQARA